MKTLKLYIVGAFEMLTFKTIDSIYPKWVNIFLGIVGWLLVINIITLIL